MSSNPSPTIQSPDGNVTLVSTAAAMDDPLAGLAPRHAHEAREAARGRLRRWRLETMELRGWTNAAYRVFPNTTLNDILRRWPTTSAELRACKGIGDIRLSNWQVRPYPPEVTPLLTILGPRPVAAGGAAPALRARAPPTTAAR